MVVRREPPVALVGPPLSRHPARPSFYGWYELPGRGRYFHPHRFCRICPPGSRTTCFQPKSYSVLATTFSSPTPLPAVDISRAEDVHQPEYLIDPHRAKDGRGS